MESRRERTHVVVALDELDEYVAIEVNRRGPKHTLLVPRFLRRHRRIGAATRRFAECGRCVRHFERDDADAVTMLPDKLCGGVIRPERRREDKPNITLLEHI